MDELSIKQYNAVVKQNKDFYGQNKQYRETLKYIVDAVPTNYETFKQMVEDLQFKAKKTIDN